MKFNCILFDLDGTLLNTNDLVISSMQHTIRLHLGKELPAPDLYRYMGQPLVEIMADLDPSQADEMVKTFRIHNLGCHDELVTVFPKAEETLQKLQETGIVLGIVTSKMKSLALRGLELFHLDRYFNVCVAFEDTDKHKPEAAPILKALELMTLGAGARVMMIGDSPYDISCAKNAGVNSAVVEWSLHPRNVLESYKPDIWLKDFPQLLDYVAE